ncbi:3'-5' ssDNA/RNA exonuclease TatD [Schistocerca americana]|uniref:3'-5' ssDNA/RNA exonuclease TatD n=1 Tax=Schistocerca americana TaxID=7009 RepID=UPI001F502FCB|nr:3'-5' ssDNA/RNA exonuclease TatD [Schistocerca americana]XP_047096827.1 3'-5' ssDNA/RNA exonuclease TatD [Schistocerca piceifrons]XP_049783551.1 3'-5' ssDNA/RNA exonuclease TatD [Schistocerca cancellata]XP_049863943.1 3'-5' ssDNA/RNA exonuclease TatD [Schistocerca gregaria]XP_049960983.1 3'-5' ssDNA/RNA exonuclease TatD [Schistocerca serialis cubense]
MATHSGNATEGKNDSEKPVTSPLQECYENYILIDIGANLTNKKYGRDLDSVVQRAKDAGVQKIIVTGTSLRSSKEALRLTRIFPGTLYSTAGIHPHDAKSWTEGYLDDLRDIASNPECVAIGECGLDYNRDFSTPDMQREVLEKQVALACELRKPLLLHERDAHKDLIKILEKYKENLPSVVIHCFSGTFEEAESYIKMGIYLGITGYLCKDKSDNGVRKLLESGVIPLEQLMVETDSPFMYPNTRASKLPPHVKEALTERSLTFLQRYCTFQRNEPCSLPAIVEMVGAFMRKGPEEVALATAFNALKVFGLSH